MVCQVYKERVLDVAVNCAREAVRSGVKRFIHVSTAQVYNSDKVHVHTLSQPLDLPLAIILYLHVHVHLQPYTCTVHVCVWLCAVGGSINFISCSLRVYMHNSCIYIAVGCLVRIDCCQ